MRLVIILLFVLGSIAASAQNEVTLTLPGNVPLEMVRIPAGSFDMGSPDQERGRLANEGPVHHVVLTHDFYMGRFEVTQKQWEAIMGNNPAVPGLGYGDGYPVYNISANEIEGSGDSNSFINRLDTHLRLTGQPGVGQFRLPTEAEWEYAARAGTQTRFSFGDNLDCDDDCDPCWLSDLYIWWCGNSTSSCSLVGMKRQNQFGLYDMHGNLYEWVKDWYGPYPTASQIDPAGPTSGTTRIIRGGAYYGSPDFARSAARDGYGGPDGKNIYLGFRLVANGLECRLPGDLDGDGKVTIGEVQKVINAYLGTAGACPP